MTRDEARTRLGSMVSASTPPVLDQAALDAALDAARVVDSDGRAPVDDGYVETFDLNYAAAEAFDMPFEAWNGALVTRPRRAEVGLRSYTCSPRPRSLPVRI